MTRPRSLRVGYLIDVHGGPYDQALPPRDDVMAKLDALVEEGLAAERAGFHSLAVPDRHGRTETYFPGPMQLLTILARETSRAALGTFSLVSTLVHPMMVAEQAVIIDNLSAGRFFLALARGYHEGYWNYFGVKPDRLLGRHLEAVRVIQRALAGERFSFDGDFYEVKDSILAPQAYQVGGFPIWGGGDSVAAMLRGVEYGDAWPASPFPIYRPAWEARLQAYRERCESLGKQPYVVLLRDGWVADSFEQAAAAFGEHYVEEMRFYARQGILQQVHPQFEHGRQNHGGEHAEPRCHGNACAVRGTTRGTTREFRRRLHHDAIPHAHRAILRGSTPADQPLRSRSGRSDTREVPRSRLAPGHPDWRPLVTCIRDDLLAATGPPEETQGLLAADASLPTPSIRTASAVAGVQAHYLVSPLKLQQCCSRIISRRLSVRSTNADMGLTGTGGRRMGVLLRLMRPAGVASAS